MASVIWVMNFIFHKLFYIRWILILCIPSTMELWNVYSWIRTKWERTENYYMCVARTSKIEYLTHRIHSISLAHSFTSPFQFNVSSKPYHTKHTATVKILFWLLWFFRCALCISFASARHCSTFSEIVFHSRSRVFLSALSQCWWCKRMYNLCLVCCLFNLISSLNSSVLCHYNI